MVLVDTSVWIAIFRDATGVERIALTTLLGEEEVALSRFHALELLQGCRNESEWDLLKTYLSDQHYLELNTSSWEQAARIYFDLRRRGRTVTSPIDCCIAQLAIDHNVRLIHRDKDFEAIANIRPLRQAWLK